MTLLGTSISQILICFFLLYVNKIFVKSHSISNYYKLIFNIIFILIISIDLSFYFSQTNYFTFLNIKSNFTFDELKKEKLILARKFHPDKSGSDGADFSKFQDLFEILSDYKNKNIIKIYDLFNVDLIELHVNKSMDKDINSYYDNKMTEDMISNYSIVLLILFSIKELNIKSKPITFVFIVLILTVILIENALYEVFESIISKKAIILALSHFKCFDSFRTIELIELLKRFGVSMFMIIVCIYQTFIRKKNKINSKKAFDQIKQLEANDDVDLELLVDFFKKKISKLERKKQNSKKSTILFISLIVLYWIFNYFEFL